MSSTAILKSAIDDVAASPSTYQSRQDFWLLVRLEGAFKTGHAKILYSDLNGFNDLVATLLARYLPEYNGDGEAINARDYDIKICELGEWPTDIKNTKDLEHAALFQSCRGESLMRMQAIIDEPDKVMNWEPTQIYVGTSGTPDIAASAAGEKRKATHLKRATKKSKGEKTPGRKLPVRTRIIQSIAELRALGSTSPPRIEVAMFAGYGNSASKGFTNPLSQLKSEGLIEYPNSKTVALTTKGIESEEAKCISPPKDNFEVHSRIKTLLKPKQVEIFDKLADGRVHERHVLADSVGYKNMASKGFANSIGKMSSLGILHYPTDSNDKRKKLVQLTDMCFPFSPSPGTAMLSAQVSDQDIIDFTTVI